QVSVETGEIRVGKDRIGEPAYRMPTVRQLERDGERSGEVGGQVDEKGETPCTGYAVTGSERLHDVDSRIERGDQERGLLRDADLDGGELGRARGDPAAESCDLKRVSPHLAGHRAFDDREQMRRRIELRHDVIDPWPGLDLRTLA